MSIIHALDGQPLLQIGALVAAVVFTVGNIAGFAVKFVAYRQHARKRSSP